MRRTREHALRLHDHPALGLHDRPALRASLWPKGSLAGVDAGPGAQGRRMQAPR